MTAQGRYVKWKETKRNQRYFSTKSLFASVSRNTISFKFGRWVILARERYTVQRTSEINLFLSPLATLKMLFRV